MEEPCSRLEVFALASGPAPLAHTVAIAAEALINNAGCRPNLSPLFLSTLVEFSS